MSLRWDVYCVDCNQLHKNCECHLPRCDNCPEIMGKPCYFDCDKQEEVHDTPINSISADLKMLARRDQMVHKQSEGTPELRRAIALLITLGNQEHAAASWGFSGCGFWLHKAADYLKEQIK